VAAATVLGELSIEEALILGVVLAPTDAALGRRWSPSRACRGGSARGSTSRAASTTASACPAVRGRRDRRRQSEISGGRSASALLLEEIGYGVLGGAVAGLLVAIVLAHGLTAAPLAGRYASWYE